jgi:hypothetical protein
VVAHKGGGEQMQDCEVALLPPLLVHCSQLPELPAHIISTCGTPQSKILPYKP